MSWSPRVGTPTKRPPGRLVRRGRKELSRPLTPPPAPTQGAAAITTWDEVEALVLAGFDREGSKRTYLSAFRLIRRAFPDLTGPAALTAEQAEQFALAHAASKYRRTKGNTGTERSRSAQAVRTAIGNLSVLWNRMRKKSLRLVTENVWRDVTRPKKEKKLPRVPPEESFDKLHEWLLKRFPGPDGKGWPLLQLFIDVKSLAGCRLNDLCQVKSWQFDPRAGSLLIHARQDMNRIRNDGSGILPPRVGRRRVGPADRPDMHLWELAACEDSAIYRPGKRRATCYSSHQWSLPRRQEHLPRIRPQDAAAQNRDT